MPRMDGFGFIEGVRSGRRHRAIPILVLTTESDAEKKARARQAGATGWIVKPFNPAKLVDALRRVARLMRDGPRCVAIKETFFQECEEQLAELETGLLVARRRRARRRSSSTPCSARCTPSRAALARSASRRWSVSPTHSRPRSTRLRSRPARRQSRRDQGAAARGRLAGRSRPRSPRRPPRFRPSAGGRPRSRTGRAD